MADSTSAVAGSPVSGEDLARAEKFTFEPYIHEGDDPAVVLAEGTPRRCALDEAPFELVARKDEVDVVAGPRIGITKAVEQPWRYGLKGSAFLSKPFKA